MLENYKRHLATLGKKSLAINFILFSLAKSCVFFGPLLLSNLVSLTTYGLFEYAIVVAGYISIFLSGAITSYPYKIIKQRKVYLFPAYLVQFVVITALGASFLLVSRFDLVKNVGVQWVICITLITLSSNFLGAIYKTHSKAIRSVIFESILYIGVVIFCGAVYLFGFDVDTTLYYFFILLFISICSYFFISFRTYIRLDLKTIKSYFHLVRFNIPLLLTGFLVVLLTNSGRLIVDMAFSKDEVGMYSLYFRLSSGVFIIYQFINNLFLKKLYTIPKAGLDRMLFLLIIVLAGFNIALAIGLPPIIKDYVKLLEDYQKYRSLYLMISVQNIFWVAVAINENLIYRENLSKKINLKFILLLTIAFCLLFAGTRFFNLTLEQVVFFHIIIIFLGAEVQYRQLGKAEMHFPKVRIVNYLLLAVLIFSFIFF
jgi:O-antigen/teichoic acid export membrane protein